MTVNCRMSSSEFESSVVSVPSIVSPSSSPKTTTSIVSCIQDGSIPDTEVQINIKNEVLDESSDQDPSCIPDIPCESSHAENTASVDLELPPEYSTTSFNYLCNGPRPTNLFLFTTDGNFATISPHQMLDVKDLDKGEAPGIIFAGRPVSRSSLPASSSASPKTFATLQLTEIQNEKMLSTYDSRVDRLSPLSVIAVSAYQDSGQSSPHIQSSVHPRSQPVLRYHPGGDTMLSSLNYNDSEIISEGGFEVPSTSSYSSLDGLLSSGMTGNSNPGIRLPDLLDNEISQETFMEGGQDLQISSRPFTTAGESFTINENTSTGSLTSNENSEGLVLSVAGDLNKQTENGAVLVDKLKVKNNRPIKATSPSRPGTQPCPTCGKVFSNSSALTKHKLTHSDERKYVCSLCAKAFKRQDHLNGHMLTHRNKKPYECDAEGCGKSYCDARSLRRHKENHHSNTNAISTTTISIPPSNKQVTVIPSIAHLASFSTLQSSYPASVITSNSNSSFTETTTIGNRIQYAPPPSTSALSAHTPVISAESSRTSGSPLVGSVIPANASHLQFLTFHQSSSSRSFSQSTTAATKTDQTVLTSWPTQTINTGALLLAQNLETAQKKTKPAQIITGTFSISSPDQGKRNACVSPIRTSDLLSDAKLENSRREDTSLEKIAYDSVSDKMDENSFQERMDADSNQIAALPIVTADDSAFLSATKSSTVSTDNRQELTIQQSLMKKCEVHVESPLLQQLLNQQQTTEPSRITHNFSELTFISSGEHHRAAEPTTLQSDIPVSQWSQLRYTVPTSTTVRNFNNNQDLKPVQCSLCHRKFKNIPALNGHMRLHGGYFKKDSDSKKAEKKANANVSHSPLTTASTNVRALIEEKIIQKRTVSQNTSTSYVKTVTSPVQQVFNFQSEDIIAKQELHSPFVIQSSPILSPVAQESPVFNDFPVTSQNSLVFDSTSSQDNNLLSDDWLKKLDFKQQFRVPRPPGEKYRRHSDSDHFIPMKRPCTSYTNSALADLLRRKVVTKRTSRVGSDPGEPLPFDELAFAELSPMNSSVFDFLPKFTSSSLHNSLPRDISDGTENEDSVLPILSAEDIPDAQPAMDGMKDVSEIDSNCLDKNVFFDASDTHLPVGQPFPDISVSELEMMQLTTAVTSISSVPCDIQTTSAVENMRLIVEDSNDDDDVFLSPTTLPTSPIKTKRKHKPEPLYIPPYVNTCGFTSRLRSPRLWDPSHPEHKKMSPPPYTPPPMLSPVRSGSGLFWHIISSSGSLTPKSAPITPSFGYPRKGSITEPILEEEEVSGDAPESNILPHVNIGSCYQARLPTYNPNLRESFYCKHRADKMWDPDTLSNLTDEEVDAFVELSHCAVVTGGARNEEYAYHVLQRCRGNIQDAILFLMDEAPRLPSHHALLTFKYAESDKWTTKEIESFHQGLLKCDKDFYSIAKEIPNKNVKQCIQFYYLWKKVCPDEYKRIRLIRRRKEQESLYYNLRSKEEEEDSILKCQTQSNDIAQGNALEAVDEKDYVCNGQVLLPRYSNFSKTSSQANLSPYETNVQSSSASVYEFPSEPLEEFPCKLCGKIFNKVKSRSAHMKSHRPLDNERRKPIAKSELSSGNSWCDAD